jgi:hypothetical protein
MKPNDDVYVTGSFSDISFNIYNKNGYIFKTLYKSGNGNNVFVVKYDANGIGQWAAQMGGSTTQFDLGYGISTDSSNNVYINGYFTPFLIYTFGHLKRRL